MDHSVDRLMGDARPRADALDREQIAAEVYAVLFGRQAPVVEIGRFVIESRLGSGGMGIVYLGYDPELDRRVAIKVLDLRRVSAQPALARVRLQREARALAQLTHPNVVAVYDVGLLERDDEPEPRLYLVMEYVEGPTLRAWMRGDHDLDTRLELLLAAGRGLAAAHAANMIHGDFKPDNILVGAEGRPRVADFGLALPILEFDRASDTTRDPETLGDTDSREPTGITISGVVGTPAYIAPEQLVDVWVDARADQFAFCVVACEVLYGHRPFRGESLEALIAAALAREHEPLEDRRIPRAARAALIRGLEPDPEHRFADMPALLGALEAAFSARKRRRRVAAASSLVAALGLGAWWMLPPPRAAEPACVAAETRLEAVWNHERAAAIELRLLAPQGRGAAATTLVLARLDEQARGWGAAWTDACARPSDEVTRERMQVCLDARLLEFEAVVEALGEPERELEAPLALLEQLAPVATCLDAEHLDAERPVPVELERRRATETLRRDRLAPAKLASELGRHAEAIALARAAIDEAKAIGFRPILAEAELGLAEALANQGDTEQAKAMAERAHLSAQAGRHTTVLADAAVLRVRLAYESAEIDEGLAWLAQAEAANEAAGGDPLRSVRLYGTACALQLLAGGVEAAVDECARAQELLDQGARVPAEVRWAIATNYAMAEAGAGQLERADLRFAASKRAMEAELGPTHRLLATLLFNWGHVDFERGDFDAAVAHYERALELRALAPDRADGTRGSILVSIADAERERGQLDAAARRYREVLELPSTGRDFWTTHVARSGLALVAWRRGEAREAFEAWSQQLADEREQLDPSHPWRIDLEVNVGAVQADLGEVDAGLAKIDAAIATLEREYGPDHPELIDDLEVRADVARSAKRWDRCVADLDRAHAIESERSGPDSQSVAAIEVARAECRLALGEDPSALIPELESALETSSQGPSRTNEALARIELGRALMLVGQREPARVELERAEAILRDAQGDFDVARATIAALLE